MKEYRAIFTDIDGTLLNSRCRITERTLSSLRKWISSGRELVLSSSRGVSGIRPILEEYGLSCTMIALGGAVIADKHGQIIYETGMPVETARKVAEFAEHMEIPAVWNAYTATRWITQDRSDPRVMRESIELNNGIRCPVVGLGTFMLAPEEALQQHAERAEDGLFPDRHGQCLCE